MNQSNSLFQLAEEIRRCTSCPRWKERLLPVPGEGPTNSKIIIIGESPGKEENKIGTPFLGPSGQFLDQLLERANLKRNQIFVTNCLKCYAKTIKTKEIETCTKLWLKLQLELIQPKLIIILGKVALKALFPKNNYSLKEMHGKIIENKYFVTYHPSAAKRFPEIKKLTIHDFKKLKKIKDKKQFN